MLIPLSSFGNPNAQPPTPTQTPTSGQFPSPVFQTPRNNNSSFEGRSGWSPTFAEQYSVFNSTPGRLINTQYSFAEEPTPKALVASLQIRHLSAGSDIAAEIASHVHHFSPNPSLSLPPVDPSNLLPSSPDPYSTTHNRFDDSLKQKVTPRRPRKRLEEAFSGQTATPPATASKGSRKLAPKISRDKMQNDSRDSHYYGASQTPTQSAFMSFTESSGDFCSFPMSAPATASAFAHGKPFWNADASMSGMDMDFSTDSMFNTNAGSHKLSNSFDWGRSNQMFQDTMNVPHQSQDRTDQSSASKRQRPLAPKLSSTASSDIPTSIPPYSFHSMSAAEDPFGMTDTTGGVDPGLLFSRPSSQSTSSNFGDVQLPPPRPVTSQAELRPYQHQLRESRRDQEDLRRSRSSRDSSRSRRLDRGTVSSPVRSSRPSIQRSVSERGRRTQGNMLSNDFSGPRLKQAPDRVMLSRSGRISPVKQRPSVLTSIPELLPPRTRTEVKFTIDANGRARTETVVIEEPRSRRGGSMRRDEFETSSYDSSSDDEPIVVPSRNSSFNLPNAPNLSRFEMGRALDNHRQSSYSQSESSSQRSFRQQSVESEAETVMEEDDGSGDATRE